MVVARCTCSADGGLLPTPLPSYTTFCHYCNIPTACRFFVPPLAVWFGLLGLWEEGRWRAGRCSLLYRPVSLGALLYMSSSPPHLPLSLTSSLASSPCLLDLSHILACLLSSCLAHSSFLHFWPHQHLCFQPATQFSVLLGSPRACIFSSPVVAAALSCNLMSLCVSCSLSHTLQNFSALKNSHLISVLSPLFSPQNFLLWFPILSHPLYIFLHTCLPPFPFHCMHAMACHAAAAAWRIGKMEATTRQQEQEQTNFGPDRQTDITCLIAPFPLCLGHLPQ